MAAYPDDPVKQAQIAADIAKGMAYLRKQLLPLASVWAEEQPAPVALRGRADVLDERLRALDADDGLEAHLKDLFDDVVDVTVAFPEVAVDAPLALTVDGMELIVNQGLRCHVFSCFSVTVNEVDGSDGCGQRMPKANPM